MTILCVYCIDRFLNAAAHDCVNRKDCDTESKKKLMMELHDLIRGKAKQVSLSLPIDITPN